MPNLVTSFDVDVYNTKDILLGWLTDGKCYIYVAFEGFIHLNVGRCILGQEIKGYWR